MCDLFLFIAGGLLFFPMGLLVGYAVTELKQALKNERKAKTTK